MKCIINSIYIYLGQTKLFFAADSRRTDVVRFLLDHGADVNTKDTNGKLHTFISVYIILINTL